MGLFRLGFDREKGSPSASFRSLRCRRAGHRPVEGPCFIYHARHNLKQLKQTAPEPQCTSGSLSWQQSSATQRRNHSARNDNPVSMLQAKHCTMLCQHTHCHQLNCRPTILCTTLLKSRGVGSDGAWSGTSATNVVSSLSIRNSTLPPPTAKPADTFLPLTALLKVHLSLLQASSPLNQRQCGLARNGARPRRSIYIYYAYL